MTLLTQVLSLTDLKKQYRKLAIVHHPDKGGDVEIMKVLNVEFEKLHLIWKDRKDHNNSETYSGYENDFAESSAREYTDYVYNEYKFRGSNYNGQRPSEVCKLIRVWLKETYPHYKFSVRCIDYNSIHIDILKADFEPFINKDLKRTSVNIYHIDRDPDISMRAKEVVINIKDFAQSYNFDNSDPQTDHFSTNFYLNIEIGNSKHLFEYEPILLKGKKSKPTPKTPEGKAHKAIRLALGNAFFENYSCRVDGEIKALGTYSYWKDGEKTFYPLSYAGYKTAMKRMNKLKEAGIICKLLGDKYMTIQFIAYTPETEEALRREEIEAEVAAVKNESKVEQVKDVKIIAVGIEIVDYSEKAIAVIGDTKSIKDTLKQLGGRYNPNLSCGAGWIFSKKKKDELETALGLIA